MTPLHQRHRRGARVAHRAFVALAAAATVLPLLLLLALLADVALDGLPRLSWEFITSFPSRKPELAGIAPALVGSLWVIAVTATLALPLGVAAAIYLEEYGTGSRAARFIEGNIANLAGVPSVIYGLLGLEFFVRAMRMDRSVLAGASTLALLVLPVVITATREALRAVPSGLREAALGLGATRWMCIRTVVLPEAFPGILTGAILAISRALGETAPLVVVGALTYMTFVPDGPNSPFTVLPIQIFNWVSRPQKGFVIDAAAAILVLMAVLLVANSAAIVLRDRARRRLAR